MILRNQGYEASYWSSQAERGCVQELGHKEDSEENSIIVRMVRKEKEESKYEQLGQQ